LHNYVWGLYGSEQILLFFSPPEKKSGSNNEIAAFEIMQKVGVPATSGLLIMLHFADTNFIAA